MLTMVFDTETGGFPSKKVPLNDPSQPGLVQFGIKIFDGRRSVFELGTIVSCPQAINPKAQEVHGISSEMCKRHGILREHLATTFVSWISQVDRLVCHNFPFDSQIMQIFLARLGINTFFWEGKETVCTMRTSTDICNLPGPYGKKWPKLIEAYKVLVDPNGFEGAHDALVDVNACAKILWALEDKGVKLHAGI